jgi:DNA repair photolyase
LKEILVKSVLNKKKKRDDWFLDEYTLNPYEGCPFNCQYCYVRGSKYGVNMEDGLAVKINGAEILDKQLSFRARKNQYGIIALASATDPYIKIEKSYRLTERFLHLILKHRFPVLMITKSDLILRDIELLKQIDATAIHAPDLSTRIKRGAIISFSFSTLDEKISSTLEPGAPLPAMRLDALKKCKDTGLMTGVNLMPLLPFINDSDEAIEKMINVFKNAGADYVLGGGLTLFGSNPADSKTLYYKFLERSFPDKTADYKKLYGIYFFPPRSYHDELTGRIKTICKKYGIRSSILE